MKLVARSSLLTTYRYNQNQSDSPLLRLSAELRNAIYSLVLGNLVIWPYHCNKASSKLAYTSKYYHVKNWSGKALNWISPQHVRLLALTKICRQIYHETSVLAFALNKLDGQLTEAFVAVINSSSTQQRDDIEVVRIGLKETIDHDNMLHFEYWVAEKNQRLSVYHGGLIMALGKLRGLKRLEVAYDKRGWIPADILTKREEIYEQLREIMAGRSVEIVFDEENPHGTWSRR
jgi:hypothetical protein